MLNRLPAGTTLPHKLTPSGDPSPRGSVEGGSFSFDVTSMHDDDCDCDICDQPALAIEGDA